MILTTRDLEWPLMKCSPVAAYQCSVTSSSTPITQQPTAHRPRTWQLWERPSTPPPFQLQERDRRIIEAVFKHRFLTVAHLHALLGGSEANLSRRCRLLWQHGYLERPKALRPLKILTEQLVYGLGKKGARELDGPALPIGRLDWSDRPGKPVGLPYVDHQLAVGTFMVALQVACSVTGNKLHWSGPFHQRDFRIEPPGGEPIQPDAFFILERADGKQAAHFLEIERSAKSEERLRQKYEGYYCYWRSGRSEQQFGFKHFRVLFVATGGASVAVLRRSSLRLPGSPTTSCKSLLFTSLSSLTLTNSQAVLGPTFRHADGDETVALV